MNTALHCGPNATKRESPSWNFCIVKIYERLSVLERLGVGDQFDDCMCVRGSEPLLGNLEFSAAMGEFAAAVQRSRSQLSTWHEMLVTGPIASARGAALLR